MSNHLRHARAGHNGGFTLVELMVSMLLGLVIIGGATAVIIANRQSYRTNEGLSQLQESARSAFELMARDIRQAGVTGCDSNGRVANVVRTDPVEWWQDWVGMRGFDGDDVDGAVAFGTDARTRVAGTHSLLLQGLDGNAIAVATHTTGSPGVFRLNTPATNIAAGDIVMVCDFRQAAIFVASGYNSANRDVSYTSSDTGPLRNCSPGLGFPTICSSPGNAYGYSPNAQLARLMAVDWFVGNNGREGGRSLYRQRIGVDDPEEMVVGVSGMELNYLVEGGNGFVAPPVNWATVTAIEVRLTLESTEQRVSTDPAENQGRLERSFTNVITLRNRVQ